jgi:phenylacetate-CoA ligase
VGVRTAFYRNVVYHATDLAFRRDTFESLDEVRRLRALPPDALRAYQLERLRAVVGHAERHVPYYRDRFAAAGVKAPDIQSLEDLSRLPLLTKANVREHQAALRSDDFHGRWKLYPTSGSTGTPLVVLEDQGMNGWRRAVKWNYLEWWGVQVGERGAVIWLQPLSGIKGKLTKRLGFALNNCNTFLNVADLSDAQMQRFFDQLVDRGISYLYGYTSAVTTFAQFILRKGLHQPRALTLKVAIPTTETLFPQQRRWMEEAFGCRVADEYGCAELGDIGFECPHGRMHIGAETYLVDLVPPLLPKTEGVCGQIAVTHLRKTSFPMIRYALGDVVHLVNEACPCGRTLPIIRSVVGRVSDIITTPDGRVVHSEVFDYIMREFASPGNPAVTGFRAIQKESTVFEVLVVPGSAYRPETAEGIAREVASVFGKGSRVSVREVDAIPPDPSGKIRFFLSEVPRAAT